jgi:hypothetical protein
MADFLVAILCVPKRRLSVLLLCLIFATGVWMDVRFLHTVTLHPLTLVVIPSFGELSESG